jgi:hypothetical protein
MKPDEITAALGALLDRDCPRGVHVWTDAGLPLFFFSDNQVTITDRGMRYREGRTACTIIGWCTVQGVKFVLRNPGDRALPRHRDNVPARSNAWQASGKAAPGGHASEPAKAELGKNVVELFSTGK